MLKTQGWSLNLWRKLTVSHDLTLDRVMMNGDLRVATVEYTCPDKDAKTVREALRAAGTWLRFEMTQVRKDAIFAHCPRRWRSNFLLTAANESKVVSTTAVEAKIPQRRR